MAAVETIKSTPWWREPTKDQWYAFVAAWLGWTLDAFDFTIFLLIMVPIAEEFKIPLTDVTIVFTLTLWMRLIGATASGWMADRMGRKVPLMISIFGYSMCNFIAGFSPTFWFLLFFRALLGFFMGAEWPAGASLAMETWPIRSRGFMSGVLQGSWGLGYLLSSAIYGLFYSHIGWRGMLWVGIAPALALVYIRYFVKEPAVWLENRRLQRAQRREVRVPLLKIFKPGMLGNTLTTCWFQAAGFVTYYSINALFPTHLQSDRALPDRDPRHRDRLLLPRRCDSRRHGAADPDLFCDCAGLGAGLRDPDADRNPVWAGQFHPVGSVRPGDQGDRHGRRAIGGVSLGGRQRGCVGQPAHKSRVRRRGGGFSPGSLSRSPRRTARPAFRA